jgi:hypothetical protein
MADYKTSAAFEEEVEPLSGASPAVAAPATSGSLKKAALALSAVGGFVAVVGGARAYAAPKPALAAVPSAHFAVSNEYTATHGLVGDGRLKWEHIVEPHRATTFTALVDGEPCGACDDALWTIDGASYTGAAAQHAFERAGLHDVSLVVPSRDVSYETTVMSKWVRREIRDLSAHDRERFLNALHTLWFTDTATGQLAFNSTKYKGAEYFIRKHLYGAASTECDHWHDNAGLMTHHMAFTLELEQSLQAINADISVPYWEYSLDAQIYGTSWQDSFIFGEGYFGEASPTNVEHTVATGRWAYTPIMANAREYSNITNQWGLLRSPWNQDPVPYVQRHKKILGDGNYQPTFPGCSDFDEAFTTTSFSTITPYLNGLTHGPVHLMIGGQWHQNSSGAERFWANEESNFLLMSKVLWRHGFVRCDDTCTEGETDLKDCTCTCPAEYLERFTPYEILTTETGILHWLSSYSLGKVYYDAADELYHIAGYTKEQEMKAWGAVYEAMCDPGWTGEMFTSGAPADPVFFVIHTTAERFLWTRILNSLESPEKWPFDQTWGYDHDVSTPSDYGEVCHWEGVEGTLKLPTCTKATCAGHNENDVLPFGDFISGEDDAWPYYTNKKFWKMMQPTSEKLPYTYDTFSYPWCSDLGYDWSA